MERFVGFHGEQKSLVTWALQRCYPNSHQFIKKFFSIRWTVWNKVFNDFFLVGKCHLPLMALRLHWRCNRNTWNKTGGRQWSTWPGPQSHCSSDHYSRFKVLLLWEILKSGDGRTDVQTTRAKIVITTALTVCRPRGSKISKNKYKDLLFSV